MNMSEAVQYLKDEYEIDVKGSTVVGWIRAGHLKGEKPVGRWLTTEEAIDESMSKNAIPPKAGRKSRYTRKQREQMIHMRAKEKSLKEIAAYFGCDDSYVSLVTRGLR